ncbi:hypothetical protein B7R21_02100 [Subtercola boreus]|uniref:Potassium transporter Trk n=1 Tax=Subtercola boreus TaxID=120213 RepID=A0A3E0W362_9MICO|nr:hypothetical protein [Subtercola boreus]RFA16199.1 hypothetical protein B7R21_02100 [Subtercola boreus]
MSDTDHPEAEPTPSGAPDRSEQEQEQEQEQETGEQDLGSDTVTIHRSPRYFRFMIAGVVAGVIAALVLTFAFPQPAGFNPAQIFGFLGLLCVVAGIVLGSAVALIIDRASRRRATTIQMERVGSSADESLDT